MTGPRGSPLPCIAETLSNTSTTRPYRIPPRTHATEPDGLKAAMIRPIPRTAAAADPLVPTCSSIALNDCTRTVPTAPPRRPMPIRSIPIRRISGLTPATVYGRYGLSHGLDSIHGQRRPHHARRAGGGQEGARRADHQAPALDRRQDPGSPRA